MRSNEEIETSPKGEEKQDDIKGLRKMLSFKQVLSMIPLSRSSIERKVKDGKFPKPYRLAPMKVGFFLDELIEWQKELVEEDRL